MTGEVALVAPVSELNLQMIVTLRANLVARCGLLSLLVCLAGCPDPPATQPSHNRTHITTDGQFVGHLKPVPPPVGPGGKPVVPDYPVVWVVDGGEAKRTDGKYDVHTFRLDFDEKQTLSEQTLPFALMTKDSHEVIVHRGPPSEVFTHPDIRGGEEAYDIVRCINRECPQKQVTDNGQLLPAAPGQEPVCPACGKSETYDFVMPQHREMREVMERQMKP